MLNIIGKEIKAKSSNLLKLGDSKDKKWTIEIKNVIAKYGKMNNLYVCAGGSTIENTDCGEWLYDITLIKYYNNDPNEYIIEIPFICESEWKSAGEVRWDFEKLIQSRAKNKLMIFQAPNQKKAKEIYNNLEKVRNIFRENNGEEDAKYLYMCWNNESNKFITYKNKK